MPRLSVCITTRNREAYIAETLESILSQCPPEVEVVVVDGASTDGTVAVVRGVASRYPQLRLLTPAENSGLDADFDKAVQAAQRDRIAGCSRTTICWCRGLSRRCCTPARTSRPWSSSTPRCTTRTFGRTYKDHRLPAATRGTAIRRAGSASCSSATAPRT